MWTGALWNGIQEIVPSGSTLAPIIIASDKTQLTQFTGGKSAYPVYLTIGNLPKSIHRRPGARACVLIAYLSVDKMAKVGRSKKMLQLRNYELFHRSMLEVLAPLKAAGNPGGKGMMLIGGNGEVRWVYPFLASYVADYPEQCLVTCTKYGTCPKCRVKATDLGAPGESEERTQTWTETIIKEARSQSSPATQVHSRCMKSDVAGGTFRPFWVDFPFCDIHGTISPDVLHQLYQGVLKHLIYWIQLIMTEEEFDVRLRSLPPAFGVQHFAGGISSLKQVTGLEQKHLAKVLLACLAASSNVPKQVVVACRAILDFIYLAQYPSHDEDTLSYMQGALDTWHSNKSIFVELNIRLDFNIPKFHSLTHYISSIPLLGATDNTNTEIFERLHKDLAKEGWRASNKRNHFPQMIGWLSRQEKVASFDYYRQVIEKECVEERPEEEDSPEGEVAGILEVEEEEISRELRSGHDAMDVDGDEGKTTLTMAKRAPEPKKAIARIVLTHGAPSFIGALKLYLNSLAPNPLPKKLAIENPLHFSVVEVWHQFKLTPSSLFDDIPIREIIKALPVWKKSEVARYNTVLVMDDNDAEAVGVEGCRVGQIRVIFRLPKVLGASAMAQPSPSWWKVDEPLVYVQWFSRFKNKPDVHNQMYVVERSKDTKGQLQGAVIPLSNVRQGCMLSPASKDWSHDWETHTILDQLKDPERKFLTAQPLVRQKLLLHKSPNLQLLVPYEVLRVRSLITQHQKQTESLSSQHLLPTRLPPAPPPVATTSKSVTSKAITSKAITSKATTSKAVTSKAVTSKATTSKAVTSKAVTSKATTSKAVSSKATTSKAVTSETTSKATTSKASASKVVQKQTVDHTKVVAHLQKYWNARAEATEHNDEQKQNSRKDSQKLKRKSDAISEQTGGPTHTSVAVKKTKRTESPSFGTDLESESDPENSVIQKFSREAKRSLILSNDNKEEEEEVKDGEDEFPELGQEDNFTEEELEELVSDGIDGIDGADVEDNMIVEDVTPQQAQSRCISSRTSENPPKVVLREFVKVKAVSLAQLGKPIYRLHACTVDMFPKNETVLYPHFYEYLATIAEDTSHAEALKCVGDKGPLWKRLLSYMNYGVSAVRLDFAQIVHMKTLAFFDIPGNRSPVEIHAYCSWLEGENRFYERDLDLKNTTAPFCPHPFGSNLIPQILRSILIEHWSKQDRYLYKEIMALGYIPLPLIVMICTLICHSIKEYSLGYHISLDVSEKFVGPIYRVLKETCRLIQEKAGTYFQNLQVDIFRKMMANEAGPISVQVYDYDALDQLTDEDAEDTEDDDERAKDAEVLQETEKESHGEKGTEEESGGQKIPEEESDGQKMSEEEDELGGDLADPIP